MRQRSAIQATVTKIIVPTTDSWLKLFYTIAAAIDNEATVTNIHTTTDSWLYNPILHHCGSCFLIKQLSPYLF